MTFADGVSAENLRQDLAGQFLGSFVGRVDTAHITLTEKGRSKAFLSGEGYGITFDKAKTPVINTGVLFNPSLLEKLRIFFEKNDVPAYINEKGEVSATAPTTATTTSDTVLSKEELQKEKAELQAKFFQLAEADQKAATARLAAIEVALTNA